MGCWESVVAVEVDCNSMVQCFTYAEWADLKQFVETHLRRIYPNVRRLAIEAEFWPVSSKIRPLVLPDRLGLSVSYESRNYSDGSYDIIDGSVNLDDARLRDFKDLWIRAA